MQSEMQKYIASLNDKEKTIAEVVLAKQQLVDQLKASEVKTAQLEAEKKALKDQSDQISTNLKDREKFIADLTQNKQQLSNQFMDSQAQSVLLQNEKTNILNQLQQLSSSLKDKDLVIAELKQSKQSLSDQVKSQENKIGKTNDLFNENKFLKQKLVSYERKLTQVAPLKDRLLKENAVLHYNLGVFYLQKQEYNDAVTEFQKVLELNPDDAPTHYNLGIIFAEYLSNRSRAIFHFKRYLSLDPKDKDADRAKKYILTWETWQDDKTESR